MRLGVTSQGSPVESRYLTSATHNYIQLYILSLPLTFDWPDSDSDSENRHRRQFGKLRHGAKTKAGPLEAEQRLISDSQFSAFALPLP
jgi:hypothetical protein